MLEEDAAIAALRDAQPAWVGLAPLALIPIAALVSVIASWLAVSIALLAHRGTTPQTHWTERARRAWPARVVAATTPIGCAIMLGLVIGHFTGPLSLVPGSVLGTLVGVASFAAAYPTIHHVDRVVRGRRVALRERLAGQAFAFLTLYPHVIIVLIAAAVMPAEPLPAAVLAAIVLAMLVGVALGAGLRVAIALGLARAADERLARIVTACSAKVGVPARSVWIVRWPMVNALAFPRTGDLAFTEEAVRDLSDDEIAEITAHELGHLGEPRRVVLARSIGLVAIFPIALLRPVIHATGGDALHGLLAALGLLLIVLVLSRIVQRIARRMEERADAVAHEHQEDHGAYARALERIYELNLVPAVTPQKRPIHPHLYDRLVSAGVMPSYPRPSPPSRVMQRLAMLVLVGTLAFTVIALHVAPVVLHDPYSPSVGVLALTGGSPADLGDRGHARWEVGDLEGALPYYRAVTALEPQSTYWASETARLEAWLGGCEAARAYLDEAMRRAEHEPEGSEEWLGWVEGASAAWEECTPR